VKFSDFENKPKLYVCNRGCDVVAVMDPVSGLAMRYVDVGISQDIEGPCMVKVSPDKAYWYVIFVQSPVIQKFRTSDNVKVGELNIGPGLWSSIVMTNDSRKAYISNTDLNGTIVYINTETMQVITTYQSGLRYPFGLCINIANDRLYATSKEGNFIYNIDISDPMVPVIKEISLETNIPVNIVSSLNPYQILLSKGETSYFVTCNKSSELRILQASNDSLLGIYSTGSNPAEMVLSSSGSNLYVSCLGVPGTNKKSVINVFNNVTKTFLPEIYAGHDSKGMIIDQSKNKLFVANRNVSDGGPAAHHAPVCDGKNGYLTAIDLNNHLLIPDFKAELSVDPFFLAQ
jgi:DNA-binding beta-propeller fold protein YncE